MAGPPLWLDEPYAPRPAPQGRLEADVAIVGGGVAGAVAAWGLAGQGLRVALLEADRIASRASGRNAGFVITSLAEPYTRLVDRLGRGPARTVMEVNEANRERLAGLVADLKLDCGFARLGSWSAAQDPSEAGVLRASARLLAQDGLDFRFVEPGEAARLLGPAGRHGAVFRPGDGQIHPARYVRGLVAAAEGRGVGVHEGAAVERLEPAAGGGWRLQGHGFEARAERVLLLANAFAPRLHPWFAPRLRPVRGQVLATAPLAGPLPTVPGPVYANQGYDYWRLHAGRLVLGGRRPVARAEEVGLEEAVNAKVQAALDRFLRDQFPGLEVQVTHRWAGIMDFSVDGFPFVGPVPGPAGLLTAVGFTGHGMGYATEMVHWLVERVLRDRDVVPPPFRSEREPVPDPGLV